MRTIELSDLTYGLKLLMKGRPLQSAGNLPPPFFVIGSGRSGTTLLRSLLQRSPEVHIPPESYVLGPLIRDYKRYGRILPYRLVLFLTLAHFELHPEFYTFDMSTREVYPYLSELSRDRRALADLLDIFYRKHALHTRGVTPRLWGDKTPINTFYLPEIATVFPQAKFVHLIRDPRAVVSSYLGMKRYTGWREALGRWIDSVEAAEAMCSTRPSRCFRLRYEELVIRPRESLENLFLFLGIEFKDEFLSDSGPVNLGDVEVHSHHANVLRPISRRSLDKWKSHLPEHVAANILEEAQPTMTRLGYM